MITKPLLTNVKITIVSVLLVCSIENHGQTLQDYVAEGLQNNLVLQQKNVSLKQADQALQIARSYFLPTVTVLADYTSGEGGRSIALPIGDLLNPVYSSLNSLTQSDAFPQVENVNQSFFPKDFHDVRVRTALPLINSDLYINRNIQGQQVLLKHYELDAYRRQLVFDIKAAFYNLLSAEAAVNIYRSALILVEKNLEVNESLLRHGKSLHANVLRSKSESERVKAELNSAQNKVSNARKYFNFLLNRPLDDSVNTPPLESMPIVIDSTSAPGNREEILMVQTTREINHSMLRMSRLNRLPKVNAFLDVGTQSEGWKYNNDSRYYLAGVQLSFPIFQGMRNDMAIRQNKLEIQKTEAQLTDTRRQLELAADIALNQLKTNLANYHAAQEQLSSAEAYFRLIEKGYKEGVNSLIEFLDARNQLTVSSLQVNVRQLEVLTAQAQLERETASYSFEN
jgi:outer membrane protein TolC